MNKKFNFLYCFKKKTEEEENDIYENGELPNGWEIMITAKGKKFFVDHMSRKTTWNDPRKKKKGYIAINHDENIVISD